MRFDWYGTAAEVLEKMADTYRERNRVYGDNYLVVGQVMKSLFPDGVDLRSVEDYNKWHLFELIVVKMTRFANSSLTHQDSIHDMSVYGAMLESIILGEENE